jgi:putative transposase
LHHGHRGVQNATEEYRAILAEHKSQANISRKTNSYDNAVSESFFSTLKRELLHYETHITDEVAKRSLFEFIEVFCSRRRLQSTLVYHSPEQFEQSLN